MKKVFGFIVASIFIQVLFTRQAQAACTGPVVICTNPGETTCWKGVLKYCCDSDASCRSMGGGCSGPWPLCVGSDITCWEGARKFCCVDAAACSDLGGSPIVTPGPTIPPYDPECNKGTKSPGIKTALGCLPTNAVMFQSVASPWAVGLGAGVAFLFGLYGAFLIITSSGDPEKVQAGKELITSVIMGLLVIIFAVFLLEIAGADILGLFPKI